MISIGASRGKFVWTRSGWAHSLPRLSGVAAILVCLLGVPSIASAQIYAWRNASGKLMLSKTKPEEGVDIRTFPVAGSSSVRAARYVAAAQARLYDDLIRDHAKLNGVRADLVKAVVQVESAYDPYARSPKGALGLMQLMPATIKRFGVKNPFNPIENVGAGCAYLRELLDRYKNDETLALAAYNAGPGAVDTHGQAVPPYRETRDYVARVNRLAPPQPEPQGRTIYKVTETVDGRVLIKYTDRRPSTGAYELVGAR